MNIRDIYIGYRYLEDNGNISESILISGSKDGCIQIALRMFDIDRDEIKCFNENPLSLGVTNIDGVNFLCSKIMDLDLVSTVPRGIDYKNDVDFISKSNDLVTVALVEAKNQKVVAVRHEIFDEDFLESYKIALIDQNQNIKNDYNLSIEAGKIYTRLTNEQIFAKTDFFVA